MTSKDQPAPRIALIHALAHSVAPINEELERRWPEAVRMNLLDDSLSADLARNGRGLDAVMHQRFEDLSAYAERTGADAILFTCSAFGPCIEAAAARRLRMPVLKPNEAMVADAVGHGGRIGLIASFGPTLESMPPEFPAGTELVTRLAEGALEALNRGDTADHDARVVEAARWLASQGCDVIALAQFSMARAQMAVHRAVDLPVLTTPGSAVRMLRHRLGA
ncbi:MAG: aspartate/glutamate racemase family protein [Hydrogenophaga sp.]|jgi:Asp/Glu/hydantoin racemase|uniref:aspartate/glutamate racemase family protein n=1 Tax=Hydrogenophaga sp. TaxID=1904254 RepID=UPI0025BBFB66|nr:aspartate/glutamate racemase family protein [Hydrogenophaga sp.]MDO8887267.1 aspartate/glutamate racemase family protein [Hydrogenophaga sp.]MDO9507388.1 aspartate/glutamate racemase family protein [Hydrogenophaga sp.]MDP1782234.1 aspartate/glutamate racemase family protein [Hydrogenophaga sp.]MDP2251415.1 aspartate/glutamate racemase family protein [Hydrogenophaga sp.]MDP2985725.1 aspartate/glutamate racemase family protein [Hydrogenophaga sp.]